MEGRKRRTIVVHELNNLMYQPRLQSCGTQGNLRRRVHPRNNTWSETSRPGARTRITPECNPFDQANSGVVDHAWQRGWKQCATAVLSTSIIINELSF